MAATSIPNTEVSAVPSVCAGIDYVPVACVHCGEPFAMGETHDSCPNCGNSIADTRLVDDLREALGYTPGPDPNAPRTGEGHTRRDSNDLLASHSNGGILGEFEILDEIGRGGMGIVYRARQPSLGRDVAIKVLSGQYASGGSRLSRFRTETRAIARLQHPNIVPIYAQGEHESTYFYAMALIDGCSLDTAIHRHPELLSSTALRQAPDTSARGQLSDARWQSSSVSKGESDFETTPPPSRTLDDFRHLATLFADVADGLAHAHDHGVVHRDIKPQNLLLSVDGRMYISDFGLSRLLDEPRLTLTGELMGTPAYLSPEQVRGDESQIDHRTDIYSLGVTMYELLTGRRPFRAKTREQVINSICSEEPARPRRVDRRIPRDLETICLRAIAKEPGRRFASAHELADELRRFAAGNPIQSKPPSLAGLAVGTMRRHRGATGIGLLAAVCLALGAGFAANVTAARRDEADRLLRAAYDQLVYFDYRAPDQVAGQVEKAEALGADPTQLNLVLSLMSLGRSDNADAITRLRTIVNQDSDAIGPKYLLAWALWRNHESAESRTAFHQAAASGDLTQPDEWFFRGLASHFDRPELAIEAYKKANDLRASQHLFFPQAILHLARAYNQQMYATRNDHAFEHAQAILIQLIQQGHYRAYPYYLLSITQRLSGDIQEAAGEDSSDVQSRFQAALDWARLGQKTNANDERPITAEAECLERLGLFDEAIEARTRAIAIAGQSPSRCESLHYRWRLHYWTGNLEAARADIQAHAECMPHSLAYAHVYPSWVAAEAGDLTLALEEARRIASEAPDDPQAVLWSAACLRFLGRVDEAQTLLESSRDTVHMDAGLVPPQNEEWVAAVFDLAMGLGTLDDVVALANLSDEPRKLRAEAFFFAAMRALGQGDRAQAELLLAQAVHCFDSEVRYTFHAKILLARMQADAQWPNWLDQDRSE